MRCKRFQCFTMRFSMFHEFVMSEAGQDGNVLQMFFYVLRSVFLMFYGCVTNSLQTCSMFHHAFFDVSCICDVWGGWRRKCVMDVSQIVPRMLPWVCSYVRQVLDSCGGGRGRFRAPSSWLRASSPGGSGATSLFDSQELRAQGGGASSPWAQSSGLKAPSRLSLSEPATHEART